MLNAQMVEHFLTVSRLEKNLSGRTLRAYRADLAGFLRFLGDKNIGRVGIDDIRRFLERLEDLSLKDTTVRRKLATLKVFFNFLEDEGAILLSPARKLRRKFRVARRLPRVMALDDIRGILELAYAEVRRCLRKNCFRRFAALRDCAMVEILFATGIRIDELVRLDLGDIDHPSRSITVFGKGRKERRLFLSSQEVVDSIAMYEKERLKRTSETPALFLSRRGQRIGTNAVRLVFHRLSRQAGVDQRFTPHCLRHTMATLLIENGADVRSVQEILGHSRISTTEIYLTVSQHRRRDVMSRFNGRNSLSLCR